MSLQSRIEYRKYTDSLLEEAFAEAEDEHEKQGMISACISFIRQNAPKSLPDEVDDGWAADFERQKIKFGKHSGQRYADVPIEYLIWLDEQGHPLRDYLRSERGKKRIWGERGE